MGTGISSVRCFARDYAGAVRAEVEAGLLDPDEPICKTWTGRGQLSHPHKYLDQGYHQRLTWHACWSISSSWCGGHWRTGTVLRQHPRLGCMDRRPSARQLCPPEPGSVTRYSSGGYWRLGQRDRLVEPGPETGARHGLGLGIPADRWDWTPGKWFTTIWTSTRNPRLWRVCRSALRNRRARRSGAAGS